MARAGIIPQQGQEEQKESREGAGLLCPYCSARKRLQPGLTLDLPCQALLPRRCLPITAKPPTEGACYKELSGPLPNLGWGALEPLGIPGYAVFRLISCSTSAPLSRPPKQISQAIKSMCRRFRPWSSWRCVLGPSVPPKGPCPAHTGTVLPLLMVQSPESPAFLYLEARLWIPPKSHRTCQNSSETTLLGRAAD